MSDRTLMYVTVLYSVTVVVAVFVVTNMATLLRMMAALGAVFRVATAVILQTTGLT